MPIKPGQVSMAGGEASPFLYPRIDLAKYQTFLKTCKNFFVHAHGGVSNRSGFRYVATTKDSTKKTRIVDYVFSDSQAYALEFGHNYVRFFTDGAQVVTAPSTPLEVVTTYDEDDLVDLKFNSSADTIYITHKDYPTKTLTRYGATTWTLADYTANDGPFMPENIDDSLTMTASALNGSTVSLTSSTGYFTAGNIGGLFTLKHYMEGNSQSETFTTTADGTPISCFSTWRIISHGTWSGKFQVQKSINGGGTWTMIREFSSADDYNANTFGTEEADSPFLVRVIATSLTSGSCSVDITTDPFYQDGICRCTSFSSSTSITVATLVDFGLTTATNAWSEGSWSDRRGYSSDSVFLQDRLVNTGSPDEPMTLHMTKTSDYTSYIRHQNLLDTDGISIILRSRQLNAINGLVALQSLLVFTSSSEWLVAGKDDLFTPTTTYRKPQGYRGSDGLDPIIVGDTVIYLQSNGQVLRSFAYSFEKDGYTGVDLRIMSSHLFVGHKIVDMAYQQDNDSIIWMVRDDGVLLSMTVMLEQEVIAFARHETDGLVESCCVIPADGYDELWITVVRTLGTFVERMQERVQSTDVMDNVFLDSFVGNSDTMSTSVTLLDHLEGQNVRIIGDGVVYPAQKVVSGAVTLPEKRLDKYVGLAYNADFGTLDIAKADDKGMVKGRKVKVSNATFEVLNSRGGWVGPDEDNLYEAFIPERDSLDEAPDLFSGPRRVAIGASYSDGGSVFYRQSDPLPITITAVVPELTP